MRKIQLFLGLLLAAGAFVAVLFLGQLTAPVTYDVAVVANSVPAFTALTPDMFLIDTQSVSPAVAEKYVLADELDALLVGGAVTVETLHSGQPLLREQVASGAQVEGLSRLAVALNDPGQVIVSVPVEQDEIPSIFPGDVVALFFAAGNVQAQALVTETVEGPKPVVVVSPGEPVTHTTELQLPVAKWIANGVVYRLNREVRENPNYGAPGLENEPRYIEGEIKSLDVVVHREDAEWVAFALAHGKAQVAVLPAVTRPDVEAGAFEASTGVTWSDFEERFFDERMRDEGGRMK
ncbi:MAG TPA: hypothetical protein VJ793_23610 [Anaerolineae bacterium]|nr:hypothetical protein [Anaerolineae bacterium]